MKNAIEVRKLEKTYKDFGIKDLTLALPQGCIMGLVGENGAGKTTTLKMILHMTKPDSGEIEVLGAIDEEGFTKGKEELGVVMDEGGFPENITATKINDIMKRIYGKWEEATYFDYLSRFTIPEGKKYRELSRGMKVKLSLAIAMSHKARLLILDEPTNGLDVVIKDEILDLFYEFTRDERNSILISSHMVGDLERICDYIAYLQNGRLILREEKDKLIETYGILSCDKKQLEELEEDAVLWEKESSYGVRALVVKEKVPQDFELEKATLEEIIVALSKKGGRR